MSRKVEKTLQLSTAFTVVLSAMKLGGEWVLHFEERSSFHLPDRETHSDELLISLRGTPRRLNVLSTQTFIISGHVQEWLESEMWYWQLTTDSEQSARHYILVHWNWRFPNLHKKSAIKNNICISQVKSHKLRGCLALIIFQATANLYGFTTYGAGVIADMSFLTSRERNFD